MECLLHKYSTDFQKFLNLIQSGCLLSLALSIMNAGSVCIQLQSLTIQARLTWAHTRFDSSDLESKLASWLGYRSESPLLEGFLSLSCQSYSRLTAFSDSKAPSHSLPTRRMNWVALMKWLSQTSLANQTLSVSWDSESAKHCVLMKRNVLSLLFRSKRHDLI
jgi:hypothetical protein